ncbi:DMT family transporter [Oricola indica]|jgi:drug/metabolite transporter (DMT)-like permease|uniref:DMT family transporter n=1 Tax=Oricola indica TaxID=2872591 RepID=UPI001CBF20A1|nr:DMT family transporter [Oricola indica]
MVSKISRGGATPEAASPADSAAIDAANLKAVIFLSVSMALFALDDMFIKLASADIGVGQILTVQALLSILYFGYLARRRGHRISRAALISPAIVTRHIGDATGAVCFVIALSLMPISNASAILQAAPLAVTLGAAVFLREAVGWRRWTAIGVGFAGVLLVIRPGMDGFNSASLFAVAAVIGLTMRDLGTRAVPHSISTEVVALVASVVILVAAIVLQTVMSPWRMMSWPVTGLVLSASVCGIFGIHLITSALRLGEVSLIAPFRYVRIVMAIGIGMVVFGERPDMYTILGTGLIVLSGLYTLYREQYLKHRRTRIS